MKDNSVIIVGDFNISFSVMDRINKIIKEVEDLNNTISQLDLDIYRTIYPTTVEHTIFSSAYGMFPKVDHMIGIKKKKPQ